MFSGFVGGVRPQRSRLESHAKLHPNPASVAMALDKLTANVSAGTDPAFCPSVQIGYRAANIATELVEGRSRVGRPIAIERMRIESEA